MTDAQAHEGAAASDPVTGEVHLNRGKRAKAFGFADGITRPNAEVVGFWVFAAFLPLALIGNLAAWKLTCSPETQPIWE